MFSYVHAEPRSYLPRHPSVILPPIGPPFFFPHSPPSISSNRLDLHQVYGSCLHPLVCWWTSKLTRSLTAMSCAAISTDSRGISVLCYLEPFQLPTQQCCRWVFCYNFNVFEEPRTDFHSGCIHLNSHQQWIWVSQGRF